MDIFTSKKFCLHLLYFPLLFKEHKGPVMSYVQFFSTSSSIFLQFIYPINQIFNGILCIWPWLHHRECILKVIEFIFKVTLLKQLSLGQKFIAVLFKLCIHIHSSVLKTQLCSGFVAGLFLIACWNPFYVLIFIHAHFLW